MPAQSNTAFFETRRAFLFGLAYRMLGSRADAQDAVQDTFIKWQQADKSAIESPAAWLTTLCTNHCVDMLRAAHRTRVDYVGAWLPEPLLTTQSGNPEEELLLASSLTTAFLLLLERLTPKERAAYLLHEIFDTPYPELARTLQMQESTCRKLVSRARKAIGEPNIRYTTTNERQAQLLSAFQGAINGAKTDKLLALLSDDIRLSADSGGKVSSIARDLVGKAEILDFLTRGVGQYWRQYQWTVADINAGQGIILRDHGELVASLSFAYDAAGLLTNVYIMRNPDKLAGIGI